MIEVIEELLFGPTIDDLQAMIESDGARRLVRQADCAHARHDHLHGICLDCGLDDELWQEIIRQEQEAVAIRRRHGTYGDQT